MRLKFFKSEYPFGPIKKITNELGLLHCDDGPALISPTRVTWYKNGKKHGVDVDIHGSINYYFENIRIPSSYYLQPEKLKIDDVLKHPNSEVRYVGMKLIGLDKIMKHPKTEVIDIDPIKDMVLFQIPGIFEEPVCYIKVVNSTAEIDGTYKNYYLCVPPNMKSCREAVAWTFFCEEKDYNPIYET